VCLLIPRSSAEDCSGAGSRLRPLVSPLMPFRGGPGRRDPRMGDVNLLNVRGGPPAPWVRGRSALHRRRRARDVSGRRSGSTWRSRRGAAANRSGLPLREGRLTTEPCARCQAPSASGRLGDPVAAAPGGSAGSSPPRLVRRAGRSPRPGSSALLARYRVAGSDPRRGGVGVGVPPLHVRRPTRGAPGPRRPSPRPARACIQSL